MKSLWLTLLSFLLAACGDSGGYNPRSYAVSHVEEVPAEATPTAEDSL